MANQLEKVKLTAENIRNSIVSSNKQLRRVKINNQKFLNKEIDIKKKQEAEDRLERKKSPLVSGASNIKKKISSSVMSPFEKVIEFASIVLTGIIVQQLPRILEIVQGIARFFDAIISPIVRFFRYNLFTRLLFDFGGKRSQVEQANKEIKSVTENNVKLAETELDSLEKDLQDVQNNDEDGMKEIEKEEKEIEKEENVENKADKKAENDLQKIEDTTKSIASNIKEKESGEDKQSWLSRLLFGDSANAGTLNSNRDVTGDNSSAGVGRIEIQGTGDGLTGKLKMFDKDGKQVGKTYDAISGQTGKGDGKTVTRREVKPHHFDMETGKAYIDGEEVPLELYNEFKSMSPEDQLNDPRFSTGDPMPDGTFPISDFENRGRYLPKKSLRVGGKPGTKSDKEFLKSWKKVNPSKIMVNLLGSSKKILPRTPTFDNSPSISAVPTKKEILIRQGDSDEGDTTILAFQQIIQPYPVQQTVTVTKDSPNTSSKKSDIGKQLNRLWTS